MTSRRSTLAFLGVAAGVVVGFQTLPSLLDRFSGMPEFEPLARPEGFRRISGGSSSSGAFDPFFGLEAKEHKARSDQALRDTPRRLFEIVNHIQSGAAVRQQLHDPV